MISFYRIKFLSFQIYDYFFLLKIGSGVNEKCVQGSMKMAPGVKILAVHTKTDFT